MHDKITTKNRQCFQDFGLVSVSPLHTSLHCFPSLSHALLENHRTRAASARWSCSRLTHRAVYTAQPVHSVGNLIHTHKMDCTPGTLEDSNFLVIYLSAFWFIVLHMSISAQTLRGQTYKRRAILMFPRTVLYSVEFILLNKISQVYLHMVFFECNKKKNSLNVFAITSEFIVWPWWRVSESTIMRSVSNIHHCFLLLFFATWLSLDKYLKMQNS